MQDSTSYTATLAPLPKSRVEFTVEIPWEHVATFESAVVKKLAEHLDVPGFRKGNVPEAIARKQLPDDIVLGDMAELAINSVYPLILREHTLDVIGRPEVAIRKIARGNPLNLTITTAVVPAIILPDYKAIASGIALEAAKDVAETDVDKVVDDLRQMRAYGHIHHDTDTHTHDEPLPEATDEFAQSFGNFKTLGELRAKIKENLMLEADQATRDKRRMQIMQGIVDNATFEVPDIVTDSEADKMFAQLEADVARSGSSIDEYLTHLKKTRKELLAEFRPDAERHARVQLVLNAIARTANIAPTDDEVELETKRYMAMYPGADHSRTRAYADMMLTNEKTFAHIEGDGK